MEIVFFELHTDDVLHQTARAFLDNNIIVTFKIEPNTFSGTIHYDAAKSAAYHAVNNAPLYKSRDYTDVAEDFSNCLSRLGYKCTCRVTCELDSTPAPKVEVLTNDLYVQRIKIIWFYDVEEIIIINYNNSSNSLETEHEMLSYEEIQKIVFEENDKSSSFFDLLDNQSFSEIRDIFDAVVNRIKDKIGDYASVRRNPTKYDCGPLIQI